MLSLTSAATTAFAPAVSPVRMAPAAAPVMSAKADLEAFAKELNPVIGYWDPLGLADLDFWGQGNDATIAFLRHAEIKHGRVAMAAFVGFIVQSNWHFPWKLTGEISSARRFDTVQRCSGLRQAWRRKPLSYLGLGRDS